MISQELGHIVQKQLCTEQLVVLPGLGGFVRDRVHAELDPLRNLVRPPRTTVILNSRLVHNDGLLICMIAKEKDLAYKEADEWLSDAISEVRFRLQEHETIHWEGLGVLSMSLMGILEFNFEDRGALQLEHYGLRETGLRPSEKDNVDKVKELLGKNGTIATKVRTLPLRRMTRYAAAAITIGLLVWIPWQQGLLDPGKIRIQQLNPFAISEMPVYSPRTFDETWISKGFEKPDLLSKRLQEAYLALSVTENSAHNVVVRTGAVPSEEVAVQPERSKTSASASSYLVIAGSFSTKNAAAALLQDMQKRGFMALDGGKDTDGQFLVAYGSYSSEKDAQRMLASVKLSNSKARIVSRF